MHSEYYSPSMKQLRDQQVRYAPRERKLQQIQRAEQLLAEIDPARSYSYEYLCFRITDYRPDTSPNDVLRGERAAHV